MLRLNVFNALLFVIFVLIVAKSVFNGHYINWGVSQLATPDKVHSFHPHFHHHSFHPRFHPGPFPYPYPEDDSFCLFLLFFEQPMGEGGLQIPNPPPPKKNTKKHKKTGSTSVLSHDPLKELLLDFDQSLLFLFLLFTKIFVPLCELGDCLNRSLRTFFKILHNIFCDAASRPGYSSSTCSIKHTAVHKYWSAGCISL